MTTLSVPSTQDYRGQSLASNIDTIDFTGTGFIKATFQPSQFGGSGISNSVMLGNAASTPAPGNGYVVEVDLTPADASFSAQSWLLGSLNSSDPPPQALIMGSSGAQTITGGDLIQTVIVAGTGVDTLLGGVAGTVFAFGPGNVQPGDVIDGGSGNRAVAAIDVTGGSLDFTGTTIANVGTVAFDAAGGTATLTADQLAAAGVTTIQDLTSVFGIVPGGNETLVVQGSNVNLSGLIFQGWASTDRLIIQGTAGNDVLVGSSQALTTFIGGPGADTLHGGAGGSVFEYTTPADVQPGEVIDGGAGNRAVSAIEVVGGFSFDFTGAVIANVGTILFDGSGNTATFTSDQMAGISAVQDDSGGNQTLIIKGSNVNLSGITFRNWVASDRVILDGTGSNERIVGGPGNNTIDAGFGNNTLTGGSGADTFVFDHALNKHIKADHITNFVHAEDKIALSQQVFGHHLKVNQKSFYASPQATHAADADDHIIYNKKTGALYYQKSPHAQAIEVAVLDHHPHINFHDFLMIA